MLPHFAKNILNQSCATVSASLTKQVHTSLPHLPPSRPILATSPSTCHKPACFFFFFSPTGANFWPSVPTLLKLSSNWQTMAETRRLAWQILTSHHITIAYCGERVSLSFHPPPSYPVSARWHF